jgi:phosphatidylglycerol---prolipoprotein diacylglyceryl transferase
MHLFSVLTFPAVDPVALQIGPIAVKWYGLAYMAGLVLGWIYIKRLLSQGHLWPDGQAPFSPERADDLLLFMTIGVIIGGRLGSVLFYEPGYYRQHPMEILQVWKGGMAFHGALLGTGVAIWLFSRWFKLPLLSAMDLCAASVPLGLMFGRIANFVNGELWGRPSNVPWAMAFPGASTTAPRHPSQLYEAATEGLLLFIVLWVLTHQRLALKSPGLVTGVFLAGYAIARSFCELFREPDAAHAFTKGLLTPGITYSIPMLLLGLWLYNSARKRASEMRDVV